jgi:hypothetical protein
MTEPPFPLERHALGPNPFPESDPRHALWVEASRLAVDDEALFISGMLERRRSEAERSPSTSSADAFAGLFDIRAKYFSIFMVESYKTAVEYEQFLGCLSERILDLAAKTYWAADKPVFLNELRLRLRQRTMHWTEEAARLADETVATEAPPEARVVRQQGKTSRRRHKR